MQKHNMGQLVAALANHFAALLVDGSTGETVIPFIDVLPDTTLGLANGPMR